MKASWCPAEGHTWEAPYAAPDARALHWIEPIRRLNLSLTCTPQMTGILVVTAQALSPLHMLCQPALLATLNCEKVQSGESAYMLGSDLAPGCAPSVAGRCCMPHRHGHRHDSIAARHYISNETRCMALSSALNCHLPDNTYPHGPLHAGNRILRRVSSWTHVHIADYLIGNFHEIHDLSCPASLREGVQ